MRRISLPYFEGAEVDVLEKTPAEAAALEPLLRNLLSLTPGDRLRDSRHVYAYYRDFRMSLDSADQLDEDMGVPQTPEAIWHHVRPGTIGLFEDSENQLYLFLEAECDWEVEHGVMMVWRNGRDLCKVGAFDGWPLNRDSDPQIICLARSPALTTRRDG